MRKHATCNARSLPRMAELLYPAGHPGSLLNAIDSSIDPAILEEKHYSHPKKNERHRYLSNADMKKLAS